VAGHVLGLVVGERRGAIQKELTTLVLLILAGKVQDVECKGPLRDRKREAGGSFRKRRRGGSTIRVV
jgi:hypothetical protein